jgi:hypothetical protein
MAGQAKLTRDVLEEVYIELRAGELSVAEIAKAFGISTATVTNINSGKFYKDPLIQYPIRERIKGNRFYYCVDDEPGQESEYWNHHYPESPINIRI